MPAAMARSLFEFVAGETTAQAEDAIQGRRPGALTAELSRGPESFRPAEARSCEPVHVEQSDVALGQVSRS